MFFDAAQYAAIRQAGDQPESEAVSYLMSQCPWRQLPEPVQQQATRWTELLRQQLHSHHLGLTQVLLHSFPLSTQEGTALMALAEALLRIPDTPTRIQLIRDKLGQGQWCLDPERKLPFSAHVALLGLTLSSRLLDSSVIPKLLKSPLEPLICYSVEHAVAVLGQQFIAGASIEQALRRTQQPQECAFLHSYDMLGESALTVHDAERYRAAYEHAIHKVGQSTQTTTGQCSERPSISIKLSALHPKYSTWKLERVHQELYPRLLELAVLAKSYGIGLTLDAEEYEHLALSLSLVERLCQEEALQDWSGLGLAVQAYLKCAPQVITQLIVWSRAYRRPLAIRLVKGAYWDAEIKRAQVLGLAQYPVYTRKAHTDLSYLVCAQQLLAASDCIYPQFATHNVQSIAAIQHVTAQSPEAAYEFQCLYGMGEPLYQLLSSQFQRPCRRYTPVGPQTALLAYLARRLLENGANAGFLNQVAALDLPLSEVLVDPLLLIQQRACTEGGVGLPHAQIPMPCLLQGAQGRHTAQGLDLSHPEIRAQLGLVIERSKQGYCGAHPSAQSPISTCVNPANTTELLGHYQAASPADIEQSFHILTSSSEWPPAPHTRAELLKHAADLLEQEQPHFIALLVREAGKTLTNALSETCEAVDFLRYYAEQATLLDSGHHSPLGIVVCISPWNFPLAIFLGQISAALAAGNQVLAKPAEQTNLIADQAVRLLYRAGVPRTAVQLLPGSGTNVGAALVADARIAGVVFTGSTQTAYGIQRALAGRLGSTGKPIPLIAETGGINAMIVDSSALPEQVVKDVMLSAFDSAGQRCSALRLLCVQEEIADLVIEQLMGAMAQLELGNPEHTTTDIGPVIDPAAKQRLVDYISHQHHLGRSIFQHHYLEHSEGYFVPPTLIELNQPTDLQQEVFGPVLHWVRYQAKDLETLVTQINALGYGLTLGIQSRLETTYQRIAQQASVGNLYLNRSQIGAVVGVQPFGGEQRSGTGPKAGGPLYLYRLLAEYPWAAPLEHLKNLTLNYPSPVTKDTALKSLQAWAISSGQTELAACCERYARHSLAGASFLLAGPTGEENRYALRPRAQVLCLAEQTEDHWLQLAAVLACGGQVVWPASQHSSLNYESLPVEVQGHVQLVTDWFGDQTRLDAVLVHGSIDFIRYASAQTARYKGAILNLQHYSSGCTEIALEWLLVERVHTINMTASGGNTHLTTLKDSFGTETQNQG